MEPKVEYRTKERQFHNEYYQGKSRKQYTDSGKLFVLAMVGFVAVLIILTVFSIF